MDTSHYIVISLTIGWFLGMGFTYYYMPDNNPIQIRDTNSSFELEPEDSVILETGDINTVVVDESHPEMEGRVGFFRHAHQNRIYLQRDRDIYDFYTTCVHEELHLRGIGSEEHDYIYEVEDTIVSENCIEAVYQYGQLNPTDRIEYYRFDED